MPLKGAGKGGKEGQGEANYMDLLSSIRNRFNSISRMAFHFLIQASPRAPEEASQRGNNSADTRNSSLAGTSDVVVASSSSSSFSQW